MIRKSILWTLVFIVVIHGALGIGIRPAKTLINGNEVTEYSGDVWVVNNGHREFSVKLYVEGTMAPYVDLFVNELSFTAEDEAKVIPFTVILPTTIPFGESVAKIVIEETLSGIEENVVASKVLLKHRIIVQGEYPDKYVEFDINFQEQDASIKFVSEIKNVGKTNIDNVQTTFYVNDKEQNGQVLHTKSSSLSQSENTLLTTEINRHVFGQGEFTVSAVTEFDGLEVELVKDMILGEPEVIPTYFTEFFTANEINTYDLDLLNKWNKEIENVYVDVDIKKDNETVDEFRTKSVDIEGLMTERISDYLDARGKDKGLYSFDMVVNFWNRVGMDQKTFHVEFVGKSSKSRWWGIILVLGIILMLVYRKRIKKK